MKREPEWLETRVVIAIHESQIAQHGGASGVRDHALLDSALARPRNLLAYGKPSMFDMAAAYAAGIVRNHPFVDGNKRTAFVAAALFLETNGLTLKASEAEAALAVLGLAAGEIPEEQFARWLKDNTVRKGRD